MSTRTKKPTTAEAIIMVAEAIRELKDNKQDKQAFETLKTQVEEYLQNVITREEVQQMIAEAELDDITLEQVQERIITAVADKAATQAVNEKNAEQDAKIAELEHMLTDVDGFAQKVNDALEHYQQLQARQEAEHRKAYYDTYFAKLRELILPILEEETLLSYVSGYTPRWVMNENIQRILTHNPDEYGHTELIITELTFNNPQEFSLHSTISIDTSKDFRLSLKNSAGDKFELTSVQPYTYRPVSGVPIEDQLVVTNALQNKLRTQAERPNLLPSHEPYLISEVYVNRPDERNPVIPVQQGEKYYLYLTVAGSNSAVIVSVNGLVDSGYISIGYREEFTKCLTIIPPEDTISIYLNNDANTVSNIALVKA